MAQHRGSQVPAGATVPHAVAWNVAQKQKHKHMQELFTQALYIQGFIQGGKGDGDPPPPFENQHKYCNVVLRA